MLFFSTFLFIILSYTLKRNVKERKKKEVNKKKTKLNIYFKNKSLIFSPKNNMKQKTTAEENECKKQRSNKRFS